MHAARILALSSIVVWYFKISHSCN